MRRRRPCGSALAATLLLTSLGCAGEPDIAPSPEPTAAPVPDETDGADDVSEEAPPSARERRQEVEDDPRRDNAPLIAELEEFFGSASAATLDEECSTIPGDEPGVFTLESTGRHQLTVTISDTSGEVDAAELTDRLQAAGVEPVPAPNPDVTLFEGNLDDGGTITVISFGEDLSAFLVWIVADPEDEAVSDLTWRSCEEQQEELFPTD